MNPNLPQSVKWTIDIGAIAAGGAHLLGWWHTYIGSITATAGFIWILIQAYYFFKGKK